MKFLLPALVVAGVLLPAAALSSTLRHAPPGAALVAPGASTAATAGATNAAMRSPDTLLVVSASGLNLARLPHGPHAIGNGGGQARPGGALPGGTFWSIAADPRRQGAAYAANGGVYATTTYGATWAPLPPPPVGVGPAGITALACDPRDGMLYAAGSTVLAWNGRHWSTQGLDWPSGAHPTALLAMPGRGLLYAAAGGALFDLARANGRWTPVHRWSGPIDALTVGPDSATLYVAVRGQGVWWIDGSGAHQVDNDGLPAHAEVYAMHSDPAGKDLYVATGAGLFWRHQPAGPADASWHVVGPAAGRGVVALLPYRGHGLLALTRGGHLYIGRHTSKGQSLAWDNGGGLKGVAPPIIAAVSGAEWRPAPATPALPAVFSGPRACTPFGVAVTTGFDVCGPLRQFYEQMGGFSLFGYPVGPAQETGPNSVAQDFEKARLEWSGGDEVRLAPLGALLAHQFGHQTFPHPSAAQILKAYDEGSVYVESSGYFVDPLFYRFWHAHLDPTTSVSIFGPPISQLMTEKTRDGTGAAVRVQYFRNARLEYTPASGVRLSYVKYGA